jgi:hypothetical protein
MRRLPSGAPEPGYGRGTHAGEGELRGLPQPADKEGRVRLHYLSQLSCAFAGRAGGSARGCEWLVPADATRRQWSIAGRASVSDASAWWRFTAVTQAARRGRASNAPQSRRAPLRGTFRGRKTLDLAAEPLPIHRLHQMRRKSGLRARAHILVRPKAAQGNSGHPLRLAQRSD